MDDLRKIDDLLNEEGFETKLTETGIEWKDAFGVECSVAKNNIVQNNDGLLAWFQDNEIGKYFVRILYKNYTTFSWRVYSNHSDWGISCNYIKWIGNKLIVIYREKHAHYLVKIENFNVYILFIGSISHLCLSEENVFHIKERENKGVLHRIYLNVYQTSVNIIPERNVERITDVQLKEFW